MPSRILLVYMYIGFYSSKGRRHCGVHLEPIPIEESVVMVLPIHG